MISLAHEHEPNTRDEAISSGKAQSDSCIRSSTEKRHTRKLPLWMLALSPSINSSTSNAHKKIKQCANTHLGNQKEHKKIICPETNDNLDPGISSTISCNRNVKKIGCGREKMDIHAISDSDNSDVEADSSSMKEMKDSGSKLEQNNMEMGNYQNVTEKKNKDVPCNEMSSVKPDDNKLSVSIQLDVEAQSIDQDDDDDDEASSSIKNGNGGHGSKTIQRQLCKYGKKCYRKNHEHLKNFSHPGEKDYEEALSKDPRPECEYGTSCYRKNALHRQHYQHTKRYRKTTSKQPLKDNGSSEDDIDSFLNDESSDDYDPTDSDTNFSDSDSDIDAGNEKKGNKRIKKK